MGDRVCVNVGKQSALEVISVSRLPNSRPSSVGGMVLGYITRVQSEHSMIHEEYSKTEALACGGGRARLAAVRKTNSGC